MRVSRQSNSTPAGQHPPLRRTVGGGGFTLVELIVVLMLMAIMATFVATSMSSFFRGRTLNSEARRMLSLTHYAQSRAVSEGVPVVLWFNPAASTYGLTVQASFNAPEGDPEAVQYTLDPNLALEIPVTAVTATSEEEDERLGVTTDGIFVIRFTPDGFYDESSPSAVVIRQGAEGAIELVQTANRLGYELRNHAN